MNSLQFSVVHRLPQHYRWYEGALEPRALSAEGDLTGLRLLSHDGLSAWEMMDKLRAVLAEIEVKGTVVEWQGEPCLFVHRSDESAATVRLKNQGVAIAETFVAAQPR